MTSTAREEVFAGAVAPLTGDRLAELLAALAETPDFETAAGFFTTQVAEAVGATRALLLVAREVGETLEVASALGFGEAGAPALSIPLDEIGNPVVVVALSLCAACTTGLAVSRGGSIPFETWTALPVPQPQGRSTLASLTEERAREVLASAGVKALPLEPRRRLGHAPFGVLLLSKALPEPVLDGLSYAVALAGPALARAAALDDLRRAAERADEQRGLLNAIVNSLPDPIVITDAVNDIILQNRRAEHLMALRDADSEGRRRAVEINNLLFTSFLARAVMTGGISNTSRELNLVDPDEGTDLLLEVLAHPLSVGLSGEGAYLSVLRDVTDLRRAANELERQVQRVRLAEIEARRERDRLNLILENVADPILVTDDRSNIILMNEQAERLFEPGTGADSARRMHAVRGNDTKFTSFISDFTISSAKSRREQMQLSRPDTGEQFPIEVVSGKILNERGESLAIVSVLHDLTKQVENEHLAEQLQSLNSELEERIRMATMDLAEQNARLQWQSREVERANRLKSEFLASMSHELRTPINALIGYTALMLDRIYGEVNAQQEEGLNRIRASAQHLLLLINDILDLAKIEAGKMPLALGPIVVSEIVAEITQQIEPLVRKKALEFRCEMPDELPIMHTDRTKVKQILLNLLSNAVKFTHAGSVSLVISQAGQRLRFEVSDTGIGIKQTDLDTIWEDFRQLDQSRTREYGGTGLGLSITRKLATALGGQVTARSEYGRGSTFTALLPLHSAPRTDEPDAATPVASFRT